MKMLIWNGEVTVNAKLDGMYLKVPPEMSVDIKYFQTKIIEKKVFSMQSLVLLTKRSGSAVRESFNRPKIYVFIFCLNAAHE